LRPFTREILERGLLNLDHAITILKGAYHSTENVSNWSTKTIGTIVNLEADLGVPILSFSMSGVRPLFQAGYEFLLTDANRKRFIETSNRAAELVDTSGYRAGIGLRREDYVPFFLECVVSDCYRTRIELRYSRKLESPGASIQGKCPKCGEVYEFSFVAENPDLSDIVKDLSPRVDSRQIIIDSVIPVLAHIGGPGETNYYSEVIPAARGLDVPFPIFARYTRLFYNTPWNENYSKTLREKGYSTLHEETLYKALRGWVEARNTGDAGRLRESHNEIRRVITRVDESLMEELRRHKKEVVSIKEKLKISGDRATLISVMREKQMRAQEIELYLSSALGRFSPERFGQEVSWAWFDIAAVAGVRDLMGVFLRQYNDNTPNSSMFFANL
jgi:hypothetical protein